MTQKLKRGLQRVSDRDAHYYNNLCPHVCLRKACAPHVMQQHVNGTSWPKCLSWRGFNVNRWNKNWICVKISNLRMQCKWSLMDLLLTIRSLILIKLKYWHGKQKITAADWIAFIIIIIIYYICLDKLQQHWIYSNALHWRINQ